MKKLSLSAILLSFAVCSAQQSNEELLKNLEQKRIENGKKYDLFYSARKASGKDSISQKNVDSLKKVFQYFNPLGIPVYIVPPGLKQGQNVNIDYIHKGQINGLSGSFKGENLILTLFDFGKVPDNHPEFLNGQTSRIINKENEAYSSHATGNAGVMGAKGFDLTNGENTTGAAPAAKLQVYTVFTNKLPGETTDSAMLEKLLRFKPEISNLNVQIVTGWYYDGGAAKPGYYWYGDNDFGRYTETDRTQDQIAYNNPDLIIVRAGSNWYGMGPAQPQDKKYKWLNGQWVEFSASDTIPPVNCSKGADCLPDGSNSKNIIVAAAANLNTSDNRYHTAADPKRESYSSAGPRDDGAIKPDIAGIAPTYTATTTDKGSGDAKWGFYNGTSSANPHITGILGILKEIYEKLNPGKIFNAVRAKALLVHSANDAGRPGPDVEFGWGLANAKKAAEILAADANKDSRTLFFEYGLSEGKKWSKQLTIENNGDLDATITWLDPSYENLNTAPNDRTSRLVNDLDIRVINNANNHIYYPYRLDAANPTANAATGDNTVDNVEKISLKNLPAGKYTVEVSHKGSLKLYNGNTNQNFAGIITISNGTLSTADEANVQLSIYPAVTKDFIYIRGNARIMKANVFDMSGRSVLSGKLPANNALDVSHLAAGVYLITLVDNTGAITTKKFIRE